MIGDIVVLSNPDSFSRRNYDVGVAYQVINEDGRLLQLLPYPGGKYGISWSDPDDSITVNRKEVSAFIAPSAGYLDPGCPI